MKRTLKSLITAGIIGLATLTPTSKAEADISGNVKYIKTADEGNSYGSYLESNVFYELPKGINGYSFVDLYGNSYFGRTSLGRPIAKGVSEKLELNQFNEPISDAGLGVEFQIPMLPKNASATVSLMPFYVDKLDGNTIRIKDKVLMQYFGSLSLPKGFRISGFGEWNIAKHEWGYGEFELGKKFGSIRASYNPSLINDGGMTPKLEHRIAATIDF